MQSRMWRVHVMVGGDTFAWVDVDAAREDDAVQAVVPWMRKASICGRTFLRYGGPLTQYRDEWAVEVVPFDFQMSEVAGWASPHDRCPDCDECELVETDCCDELRWDCQTARTPDGGDPDHGWMRVCRGGYGCDEDTCLHEWYPAEGKCLRCGRLVEEVA